MTPSTAADRYASRALQFSKASPEAADPVLGVIKTQQHMIPQAVQYFQAAVRLWPQSAVAGIPEPGHRPGAFRTSLPKRQSAPEEGGGARPEKRPDPRADPAGCICAGKASRPAWKSWVSRLNSTSISRKCITTTGSAISPSESRSCRSPNFSRALELRPDFTCRSLPVGLRPRPAQKPGRGHAGMGPVRCKL